MLPLLFSQKIDLWVWAKPISQRLSAPVRTKLIFMFTFCTKQNQNLGYQVNICNLPQTDTPFHLISMLFPLVSRIYLAMWCTDANHCRHWNWYSLAQTKYNLHPPHLFAPSHSYNTGFHLIINQWTLFSRNWIIVIVSGSGNTFRPKLEALFHGVNVN